LSEKTFRVSLVGCGRISRNHVEAISRIEGLELVSVSDESAERAKAVAEPLGIPWFTDYEKMLADIESDVVSICTPSGLHPVQGVIAAKSGRHVVTEKPMAISLKAADELVQACDANHVHLFVVKQNRLNEPVKMLKKAVDTGRFGRLYMASCTVFWARPQDYYDQAPWRGTWEFDGGAFMNQASHYVDLIQWLMGPVESVMAKTATLARKIETEDTGVAVLRFRSGALGVIEVTMLTYPKNMEGSITLLGEKGTAKIGGTAVNKVEHWDFADADADDERIRAMDSNPPTVYGYGHEGYYRNVLAVLRGDAKPETDGRAGRKSLELILGIYESARTGRDVPLPLKA
jgi:UDP-N-acetyl-2-amino-2-deoxyglucuronate dehydrogenase